MKLMLGQLSFVINALTELGKEKITVFGRYHINRQIIPALVQEHKHFEDERNETCKKYCKRDEQQQPVIENNEYQFEPETFRTAQNELNELLSSVVEFSVTPVKLSEIGKEAVLDQEKGDALIELGVIVEG